MRHRAEASGISLTAADASIVKGMLNRGDRQPDIAAWFGVNPGRIAEVATGYRFANVQTASSDLLPPKGPYLPGREAVEAVLALQAARAALAQAEAALMHKGS